MSQAVIEQDWDLVASLAADLHDAHARLVDLVAAVLAQGSWQAAGLRSPEHWLGLRAGLSRGQAAAIILLARRQHELPATCAALRQGRISLDQAAVVARHTPAAFDETVAELAQHATVSQLQRAVSRYDFTLAPETLDEHDEHDEPLPGEPDPAPAEPEPIEPAHLSMGLGGDGRFRLRYDAPAHVGALIEAALTEAKDHLFHTLTHPTLDIRALDGDVLDPDRDVTDGGPPRITWADALTLLATRSLDAATSHTSSNGSGGAARRARYRVQVHLDTDGGWLTGRPRLPRHLIEALTCDGTLTPVWETDGHPVNVGRTHRVVPHRTRVLVLDRDRGCRFPGCPTTPAGHLEIHHLTHWRDGGPTDLTNLLALCPFHHDGHHRGEFTITGNPHHPNRPDGLEFTTLYGLPISPPRHPTPSPREPAPDRDPSPDRHPQHRRPRPRLGRHYPAPTGAPLHLHLLDLTPPRQHPMRT